MKRRQLRGHLAFLALSSCLALLLLIASPTFAQDDEEAQPVLESGVPTLKYRTNGYVSRVQQVTYKGESALSFPIMWQLGHGVQFGKLYLSTQRLTYVPTEEKKQSDSFDVPRSEIQEGVTDKDGFGWWLKFRITSVRGGKKQRIAVSGKRGEDEDSPLALTEQLKFLELAFTDYDAAVRKFQLLTAGIRPLAPTQPNATAASSSSGDAVKESLWERFTNNRKTNPDVAYQAGKAYLQLYPNDSDENAQLIKKWAAAYEKVKSAGP